MTQELGEGSAKNSDLRWRSGTNSTTRYHWWCQDEMFLGEWYLEWPVFGYTAQPHIVHINDGVLDTPKNWCPT
jgi:hypothetical protein